MRRPFVTQWVMLADTQAKVQGKAVKETLREMECEELVDTLASMLPKTMAKTLLHTLADPLAKLEAKTIGETIKNVEGKALLDTLADRVVEVKTMSLWENWVNYRQKNRSTRRLTH